MTDPDPIAHVHSPPTLRADVGAAVERAWDRAVAAGALPPWPDERRARRDRGRAPGRPRPWRLREQPRDEAGPAVPDGAAGDRHRRSRRRSTHEARPAIRRPRRSPAPRSRRPASSTSAWPTRALERDGRGHPRRTRPLGPARAGEPARGQRRVRVGQPDRAAPRRQRPRRVHRRPAQPRPRGRRPARHARVLLQRFGRRRSGTSARPWPRSGAASRCPRTATRATTSTTSRRRCPTTSGRPRRLPDADTDGDRRALGGRPRPRGDRGEPGRRSASGSTSGPARRGCTTRAGSRGRSSACASAATSTSRTARSGSARPTFGDDKDRVIFRSNGEPTYFAADIGYVTEKFSRGFDHLIYIWGADHHGTVARVRNAAEAMGYDRDAVEMHALLVGPLRARRRGGLDVEAGRRVHHARRAAGRGRRRRRPLVLRLTGGDDRHRLRHRAGEEAVEREPGLLRPVRPRPDRLDPAQGGRRRAAPRPRRSTGSLAGRARGRAGPGDRALPGGRRGRRGGRGDAGDHGLRDRARDDLPRLLPRRARRRRRRARAVRGAARAGAAPPRSRSRTRSALLGISAPESM